MLYDRNQEFFKALGGGKLLKEKFISGFLLNPRAIANYRRAKASGMQNNFKGEGEIKGGLFIVGKGKSGIAYQFIERNFGDWAPLPEVIDICTRIQVIRLEPFYSFDIDHGPEQTFIIMSSFLLQSPPDSQLESTKSSKEGSEE